MKKFLLGALALLVPITLVVYSAIEFDSAMAFILGAVTVVAMLAYTANKFNMIGRRRGYNKLSDALAFAAVGDVVWVFGYQMLMFIGCRIARAVDFACFETLFIILMIYMCILGVIACIVYLIKNKNIDYNRKALVMFLSLFITGLIILLLGENCSFFPGKDTLSAIMIVVSFGIILSGYKVSKQKREECA